MTGARGVLLALGLVLASGAALAQGWLKLGTDLLGGNQDLIGSAIEKRGVLLGNIDEGTEQQMGRAAAAVLLGAAPALTDPRLQAYVNLVGLWIALHSSRPDLPWRFVVTDDDTVNAFATPGGYVIISRGLFLLMRSEHELAGVLAHEIAHVVAKHHLTAMVDKERMSFALELGKRAADQDGLLVDAVVGAARNLYASGLDKADEYEADEIGAVLAERAGYDRYGLHHALMTLEAVESDPDLMALFKGTHPPIADRLSRLREQLVARPGVDGSSLASNMLAELQGDLRQQR